MEANIKVAEFSTGMKTVKMIGKLNNESLQQTSRQVVELDDSDDDNVRRSRSSARQPFKIKVEPGAAVAAVVTSTSVSNSTSLENRKSSPIDVQEEDDVLLSGFFDWLSGRSKTETRKEIIKRVRVIVLEENCWSENDLRTMKDTRSSMYTLAVNKGISEGIARTFVDELRKYKATYRLNKEKHDAAANLLTLAM